MSDIHTHLPVRKYAAFNSGLGEREKKKSTSVKELRVSAKSQERIESIKQ